MNEDCKHERFYVEGSVARITNKEGGEVENYMLEVRVICLDCKKPFSFMGLPQGLNWNEPRMSPDHLEARLPIYLEYKK